MRARDQLIVVGHTGAREAEVVRDGQQPLLCAVMEISLEPAPLGVTDLDDPGAGRAQILELGEHFGLESLRCRWRVCAAAPISRSSSSAVKQRPIVSDHGQRAAWRE